MRAERYDNLELIDRLAREYVLGTLHGRARLRFERELAASLTARRRVAYWEGKLTPLAHAVTPVEPPAAAWAHIEERLGFAERPRSPGNRAWLGIAAGLAALAIALGSLYLTRPPQIESASYIAVMQNDEAEPIWIVQAFMEAGELRVGSLTPLPEPDENAYELWMLPGDESAPVSLGLIAGTADTTLMLTPAGAAVLAQATALAVSVEPPGGSPTGAPTGPVILAAPLLSI